MTAVEQKKEEIKTPQEVAAGVAAPQPAAGKTPKKHESYDGLIPWSQKTTGEKGYEITQFIFGKVFIIAVTAVIAFAAHPKYAKDKFGSIPNYLKKFQIWAHDKLLNNSVFPMKGKPFTERLAAIIASTLLLSHGGNTFAFFIHYLENGKASISDFFNKHFGKPGEYEIAHERLKDEPQQTWGDTIKGRTAAFFSGFGAAMTADTLTNKYIGKHKSGHYYLDAYEEWFGRKLAGLTKTGKEIGKMPIAKELSEVQKQHVPYRFGKVIALDLYLTTATLILWTFISRLSAKKRFEKNQAKAEKMHHLDAAQAAPDDTVAAEHKETHASAIKPRMSYTDAISVQRDAQEAQTAQVGA